MPDHEPKACPRCGGGFECRLGSIHRCQCVDIALSDEMRESIAQRYDDCLCRDCLMALGELEGRPASTPAAPSAAPSTAPVSARIRQRSADAARARQVRPEDLLRIMQGPRR